MTGDEARSIILNALEKAHGALTIEELREECEYQIDGIEERLAEDED